MQISKSNIEKELARPEDEVSIIKLVDSLIMHAYESRASDIHMDPADDTLDIRLRIDGVLHKAFTFPKTIHPEVISRLKVLSGLRTDEHQAAQDGRIKFADGKAKIKFDIRISITPTYHGENAVLRILAEQGVGFSLEDTGFSEKNLQTVKRAISRPYGMILVTGPTGSGKTTTLYTALKTLNTPEVAIITIEDPIEYSLDGVVQIQVNNQTSLTFANGLRSILRQDPNIIMVGEIRDQETAGIAVNAALTGHLLLSTIHTNDSATTLPRLLDMGVEPFLIASTVNVAIGQRLVRKICDGCKIQQEMSADDIKNLAKSFPEDVALQKTVFYTGKGCDKCAGSGYMGRVGIYEVLEITSRVRDAIIARASAAEIKNIAISEGMTTMIQDGVQKAADGITTIEEVLRVMHE